ncbi:unnamed protein product [Phytophthora fragariaefolia]|uniref:Unnamed protein product n=1 Tax=Phytophthora fragariaefolia TaxID=1490495 RepID=A0A9W7D061_9STRA|nr:unnamed protein product [Phytophthora fragariaefolia]
MVGFGSPCTEYRDPRNKNFSERAQPGMIAGIGEETKGYRVYLRRDRVVVTTQHVKNIETLDKTQNEQVQRLYLGEEDEGVEEKTTDSAAGAARTTDTGDVTTGSRGKKKSKGRARKKPCVKFILVLARKWGVLAKHGDVPNAYVKAEKEAELDIYLRIPQGMDLPDELLRGLGVTSADEVVLELRKALYGLRQAGRLWHKLLHKKLVEIGFIDTSFVTAFQAVVTPYNTATGPAISPGDEFRGTGDALPTLTENSSQQFHRVGPSWAALSSMTPDEATSSSPVKSNDTLKRKRGGDITSDSNSRRREQCRANQARYRNKQRDAQVQLKDKSTPVSYAVVVRPAP